MTMYFDESDDKELEADEVAGNTEQKEDEEGDQ